MSETIKSYKGFHKDMKCNGFQYEEGQEYETDKAEICECGFHACEYPLDCFHYYSPNESVFHEVEQSGEISRSEFNTKVASTKIKIGARLSTEELVQAAIDFTMARFNLKEKSDEYCDASSATGYKGASSVTEDYGASSAMGSYGASSATGDHGASSATGYKGASSATGDYGASSATGSCGASSATGYKCSSEAKNPCSIAVAWGYHGKAKGVIGSHLVMADWEGNKEKYWVASEWKLNGAKIIQIDGEKYKEDTWYTMKNGEVVEWIDE